jgi:hypothetical protein
MGKQVKKGREPLLWNLPYLRNEDITFFRNVGKREVTLYTTQYLRGPQFVISTLWEPPKKSRIVGLL